MSKHTIVAEEKELQYEEAALRRNLNRLYECRDLEIKNLWLRSVFLATFTILFLIAYGLLVSKIFENTVVNVQLIHIGAIVISIIGFTIAFIWIMMAKNSEVCNEVHEQRISKLEKIYWKKLKTPQCTLTDQPEFQIEDILSKENTLNSILPSAKINVYSPSKISTILGQICFVIWSLTSIVHGTIVILSLASITFEIMHYTLEKGIGILYLFTVHFMINTPIIYFCMFISSGFMASVAILIYLLIQNQTKNVLYKKKE